VTGFDTTISDLVNSAVDAELAGRRMPPDFDRLALVDRPRPAVGLRQWAVPVLAATMAALLAAGMVLAIALNRQPGLRRAHLPSTPVLSTPVPSTPVSRPAAFPDAGGVPEAAGVPGVSIGPVSEQDAAVFRDTGSYYANPGIVGYSRPEPKPGEPLLFTVKYIAGLDSPEVAVLSWSFGGVTEGDCPGPFLIRPVHTYLLRCRAVLRPGVPGDLTLSYRAEHSEGGVLLGINCPKCVNPYDAAAQQRAAVHFAELTAGVPESTEVTGVAVGPASAAHPGYTGLGGPPRELAAGQVVPGRSYSFTVDYIVASDGDPVAILSVTLAGVAAGRCPDPFLARAGHTYRISCQATFRTPASAQLEISSQSVIGRQTQTSPLLEPDR